jgi:hypothetical protein
MNGGKSQDWGPGPRHRFFSRRIIKKYTDRKNRHCNQILTLDPRDSRLLGGITA